MPRQPDTSPLLRRAARLLAPAVALFAGGPVAADESILTDGAPSDGYLMFIGDPKQWDTRVGAEAASTAAGYLSIEQDSEFGAVNLSWTGKGKAQFFLAHETPEDYSAHLEENAALVLVMRVNSKPERETLVRMGCGYPCGSDADITRLLGALPEAQWVRLSFDLKCFANGGLDVGNVDTPFLITTPGELSVSLAAIDIVPGAGPAATISCTE